MALSVHCTAGAAEVEREVDADIDEFERWFASKVENGPLLHAERAILKTYLWWKLQPDAKREGSP